MHNNAVEKMKSLSDCLTDPSSFRKFMTKGNLALAAEKLKKQAYKIHLGDVPTSQGVSQTL